MQIVSFWVQQILAWDRGWEKMVCQKMGETVGGTAGVQGGDVRTWKQGKVRLGQERALPKMAFVTWQKQFYVPFLFYFFRLISLSKQK